MRSGSWRSRHMCISGFVYSGFALFQIRSKSFWRAIQASIRRRWNFEAGLAPKITLKTRYAPPLQSFHIAEVVHFTIRKRDVFTTLKNITVYMSVSPGYAARFDAAQRELLVPVDTTCARTIAKSHSIKRRAVGYCNFLYLCQLQQRPHTHLHAPESLQ